MCNPGPLVYAWRVVCTTVKLMNKLKQCASDRFCRVRSFVQVAGVILILAIILIILWQRGVISF